MKSKKNKKLSVFSKPNLSAVFLINVFFSSCLTGLFVLITLPMTAVFIIDDVFSFKEFGSILLTFFGLSFVYLTFLILPIAWVIIKKIRYVHSALLLLLISFLLSLIISISGHSLAATTVVEIRIFLVFLLFSIILSFVYLFFFKIIRKLLCLFFKILSIK